MKIWLGTLGLLAGCQVLSAAPGGSVSVSLFTGFQTLAPAKDLEDVHHIRVQLYATSDDSLQAQTNVSAQYGSQVLFGQVPNGRYYAVAEAFESADDSVSISQGGPQRSSNTVTVASPQVIYSSDARLTIALKLLDSTGGSADVRLDGSLPSASYHTWLWSGNDLLAPAASRIPVVSYRGIPDGRFHAVAALWPTASTSTPARRSFDAITFSGAIGLPDETFDWAIPGLLRSVADATAAGGDLMAPKALAMDAGGALYVADSGHHRVRKWANGVFTTVAGTGRPGYSGDSSAATAAQLKSPEGLAVFQDVVYIADTSNHCVRQVVNGVISTVAGTGKAGFGGDGGSAALAQLSAPTALAVTATGDLLVADSGNHRIRRIANGTITTLVGTGNRLVLNGPKGLCVLSDGELLIADTGNHRILRWANQAMSVLAGDGVAGFAGDGGAAGLARFNAPTAVAVGPFGDVLIADSGNHRVRRLEGTVVSSVAGTGTNGFAGDNGPAYQATLNGPMGLASDPMGLLYVADSANNRIRRLD